MHEKSTKNALSRNNVIFWFFYSHFFSIRWELILRVPLFFVFVVFHKMWSWANWMLFIRNDAFDKWNAMASEIFGNYMRKTISHCSVTLKWKLCHCDNSAALLLPYKFSIWQWRMHSFFLCVHKRTLLQNLLANSLFSFNWT